MDEYINPQCNSLIVTSCFELTMASSSDECRAIALFNVGVSSSAEGELAIDEDASTVSLAPKSCVVHD